MSKTGLTKEQTSKVVNWLSKNLDAIQYGNEKHDYWRLKCSKELGFVVNTCVYNNRLHQLKHGKLPVFADPSLNQDVDPQESGGDVHELLETARAKARDVMDSTMLPIDEWLQLLIDEYREDQKSFVNLLERERKFRDEVFDLKAKLKLEVENNRQLANAQASSDQVANQTKIIEKLKDDKNKEFIRMSAIIAEQKDEILNLRSEVESLKDKVTDLEITKSVSKGYGQFGFSFNIPQPSVKF